jgi:putative acetyltransferase
MSGPAIRTARPADRAAIGALVAAAFGQDGEAVLVERLVADGDAVLELVAEQDGALVGHILFSRLKVEDAAGSMSAVALAPLAVAARARRRGVGAALVEAAHRRLAADGEVLSVVLGDPVYYGRFGYRRAPAADFASDYQCEALLALAWGEAPATGRLVYPPAFAAL